MRVFKSLLLVCMLGLICGCTTDEDIPVVATYNEEFYPIDAVPVAVVYREQFAPVAPIPITYNYPEASGLLPQ